MVVDHLGRYEGLQLWGWQFLGRLAFPCFAVACGLQGSYSASWRVCLRLVLSGLLIAPLFWWVTNSWEFPVLCTLGLGLGAWFALSCPPLLRAGLLICLGGASEFCEYGLAGAAVVFCAAGVARPVLLPRVGFAALGIGCALMLSARDAGLAPLFGLALALAVGLFGPRIARIRRLFFWAYLVQWPLLAI